MLLPSHTFISYTILLHFKLLALVSSPKALYGYVKMYHNRIGRKPARDLSWPPQRSPTQHRSPFACPRREGSFLELFCSGLLKKLPLLICFMHSTSSIHAFMYNSEFECTSAIRETSRPDEADLTPVQPHDLYPFGGWAR
jgi:hypothetical protein